MGTDPKAPMVSIGITLILHTQRRRGSISYMSKYIMSTSSCNPRRALRYAGFISSSCSRHLAIILALFPPGRELRSSNHVSLSGLLVQSLPRVFNASSSSATVHYQEVAREESNVCECINESGKTRRMLEMLA